MVYANERPVRRWTDIVQEAREMDALGTGLTGGSPTLRFKRLLRFIRKLKEEFGSDHHIHMYCCEDLPPQKARALRRAGLDEIRFHTWSVEPVRVALAAGLEAGVELPAIPGSERELKRYLAELDAIGCRFANLNELEFSETNARALMMKGFEYRSGDSMAVKGSEATAIRVLRWAKNHVGMSVHYCPSRLKDAVQLKNRLIRKARRIAKPHEEVTEEGLLYKGVVLNLPRKLLGLVRRRLVARYSIPLEMVFVDQRKQRLELHWRLAEFLAEREPSLQFALVEEYPTHDRLETTVIPLRGSEPAGAECRRRTDRG